MEINQNFEVIIPAKSVHNKIISNIKIFLENSIKVTFIANQNNLKEKYDNLEIKIIKENNISKKRNIGIENSTAEYLIFIDTDIVPNGKYLESLNLNLKKATSITDINNSMREVALRGNLVNQINYQVDPELVSTDIIGNSCCAVYDSQATIVTDDGEDVVLYVWYDNEFGYTKQVIRLAKQIAKVRRLTYY